MRQASRALEVGKSLILASVADSKKEEGQELLNKLAKGMDELQKIVEQRDRDSVGPKQKELLQYVSRWFITSQSFILYIFPLLMLILKFDIYVAFIEAIIG